MQAHTTRWHTLAMACLAFWLVVAAALWWLAWPRLYDRGCWLGEWPYENGCEDRPASFRNSNPPDVYIEQLRHNIGDSRSWAWLVHVLARENRPQATALLAEVAELAPLSPYVLGLQVESSLQNNDIDSAITALLTLVERGNAPARQMLVPLMLHEASRGALLQRINAQTQWLEPILLHLNAKIPSPALLPFIMAAHEAGLLKPTSQLRLVDRLRQDGAWLDAYTLWADLRADVKPGLYNPGFDKVALRQGFDWTWISQPQQRRGVQVQQISASPRPGLMLEVQFTGRAAVPQGLVSQPLLLLGQRYRFSGRYWADQLNSQHGLTWALRCVGIEQPLVTTPPILDTRKQWRHFDVVFDLPPACLVGATLQLDSVQAWELRAGLKGTVYFDDFNLTEEPAQSQANPVAQDD